MESLNTSLLEQGILNPYGTYSPGLEGFTVAIITFPNTCISCH